MLQHRDGPHQIHSWGYHKPGILARRLLIAAGVGIAGVLLLQAISAETFAVNSEAESGTIAGGAAKISDAAASGSQSVKFGVVTSPPPDAPYIAQALTGGNSIAFVWTPSFDERVKSYEVFRNDVKVATLTVGTGTTRQEKNARTYIDSNVTKGTSYAYKVRAITANGSTSVFKSAATVTHPTSSPPIPSITINTSKGGSNIASYLQNSAKAHLETWYPKMGMALAYPDYTPYSSMELFMDPDYDGVAYVGGGSPKGRITVNPTWLAANQEDGLGMFLHEAGHVLQSYSTPDPGRVYGEGIPDWVRDWLTLERTHYIQPDARLLTAYSEGGHMLQWGQTKYSPGLVKKVNVAFHKGTFTMSYFQSLTGGRSDNQLYEEAKAAYHSAAGPVVGTGNKCMTIAGSSTEYGARIQLATCQPSSKGQVWIISHRDTGLHGNTKIRAVLKNTAIGELRCVDVSGNRTENNAILQSWACVNTTGQSWKFNANGTILNPNSNKCLSTTNDGSEDGNQLVIRDCTPTPGQIWAWPK